MKKYLTRFLPIQGSSTKKMKFHNKVTEKRLKTGKGLFIKQELCNFA